MDEENQGSDTGSVQPDVAEEEAPSVYFGGFRYHAKRKCLISATGEEQRLRAQSLSVFTELAKWPDQVVSKKHLTEKIWPNVHVTDDSIGKCISDIRKALSDSDHAVLKTVPRQGYMLVADRVPVRAEGTAKARHGQHGLKMVLAFALVGLAIVWLTKSDGTPEHLVQSVSSISGTPRIKLVDRLDNSVASNEFAAGVLPELRVALSRYRTLELSDAEVTDYSIVLEGIGQNKLAVELHNSASSLVYAQTFDNAQQAASTTQTAQRIAASIASPGVGALDRELLRASRLKPIEELSHAECFAHGFGCSKCSGEEDNITKRAEACLAHILENDPENPRALALQATIHAHQYWWGNTLPEPLRSHLKLRKHLPAKAISAANRAEALSVGNDSAIYWGMSEAYYASCETDKMAASIERGLEINPADPNLLAAFGNWLSYSGRWDEGAALTQKALDLEPQHYRKWWWMGLAKTHYFKEEYQEAYDDFLKSFNDRNWVSHLQFAYTLPHLNRIDEAKQSVRRLQDLAPQITIEKALEQYEILCFPDSYLQNMKHGLQMAGMPSRGNSDSFSEIILPRAKIMNLNGYTAEYLDVGQGEPVVFVHGSISDYRSWGFFLVPMSENHRFITYSRRYHGTQDWVDDGENYKSKIHADDLVEFVEALDIGPVHLVSWSTGVITAMLASIDRPDLFKSAVHFEPVDMAIFDNQSVDNEQMQEWESRWEKYGQAMENNDVELALERFVEIVFQSGDGGYQLERESVQEIVRQNARTLIPENAESEVTRWSIDCEKAAENTIPTLFIKGSLTHYFYAKQTELFAQCSGGEVVSIPGVNHRGPIDGVLPMTNIISEFVAENQ